MKYKFLIEVEVEAPDQETAHKQLEVYCRIKTNNQPNSLSEMNIDRFKLIGPQS